MHHKLQSYEVWFLWYGAQQTEFLLIWIIFYPFTHLITRKIKKYPEILLSYTSLLKMTSIWCMVPEIWSVADGTFCHFGPFLPFYLTNNPKNQKFKKMKKVLGDIIILHKCLKNHDHMPYCPWNMACDGCNFLFSFWTFITLTFQKIKIF